MGSLRRKVSVHNISLPSNMLEVDNVKTCGLTEPIHHDGAILSRELSEVDCGCCVLSFRSDVPGMQGLARVDIKFHRWNGQLLPMRTQRFLSAMEKILGTGMDFVISYDCRVNLPTADFTNCFVTLCDNHANNWSARLKAAALFVKGTIFEAVAQGDVCEFVKKCGCAFTCPYVVCHAKISAEEFFSTGLLPSVKKATTSAFVSVVDVHENTEVVLGGGQSCSCVASLAPLRSQGAATYPQAHTFHVLPNGDLRVIQSPPQDVVSPISEKAISMNSSEQAADAVATTQFGCKVQSLQQLLGAHFHVGELAVDAEMESSKREGIQKRPPRRISEARPSAGENTKSSGGQERPVPSENCCMNGIDMLFRQLFVLLSSEEDSKVVWD